MSRLSRRFFRKVSKAPYISIITIVIILPLLITSFILYTKVITKAMAALFGRVFLCYRLSSPEVSIVQAIRHVMILLYLFVIYKNKVIGR
jgi:Ni,Fe-hydrogenase I cytochrome b subunit